MKSFPPSPLSGVRQDNDNSVSGFHFPSTLDQEKQLIITNAYIELKNERIFIQFTADDTFKKDSRASAYHAVKILIYLGYLNLIQYIAMTHL